MDGLATETAVQSISVAQSAAGAWSPAQPWRKVAEPSGADAPAVTGGIDLTDVGMATCRR
jgi:hypothetical protein